MSLRVRLYQDLFDSPKLPPPIPPLPPFGGAFAEPPVVFRKPSRIALERTGFDDTFAAILQRGPVFSENQWRFKARTPPGIVAVAFDNQFVPSAPSAAVVQVSAFAEEPFVVRYAVVLGEIARTMAPITAQFVGPFTQSLFVGQSLVVMAEVANTIGPLTTAVVTPPLVASDSPILLKGRTAPGIVAASFDNQFVPQFFPQPTAVFTESPWRFTPRVRTALERTGFDDTFLLLAYNPFIWGFYSESPVVTAKRIRPLLTPAADIAFLQIAYTPSAWGFSESPTRTKAPFLLNQWSDIAFLQVAYTPSALVFSESPWRLKLPKAVEQQPFEVFPITTPTVSYWGQFSESPYQLKKPTPLYPWADIAFVQISYTSGPLVFSESPWAFKGAKAFDQPGFISFRVGTPTPTDWSMFSESPYQLKAPFNLKQWADISFIQIAYNPQTWGMFAESPYTIRKAKPEIIPFVGLPTLPIALTPLVFAESPWAFKRPFQLRQWADISWLQIAYTPQNWGQFSESPYRIRGSLSPRLMQSQDFAFLQIAYTPSALVFAEQQWANRNVRSYKQRLDQPSIMPIVPQAAVATPSAFGFSESPTRTTKRSMIAVRTELGNWGWTLPPPVVTANVWEWHIRYRRRGRR